MSSLFNRFNTSKCKTQAKLCIGRVRLMRNKREAAMKQMRKEVAELLRANKQENARIRVEAVIREQNMLQAYEVLEVFLELLSVRLQLIEKSADIPNDMFECLASLVYSAARVQDFPELISIRAMLGSKFGKEFIEKASSDISCRQFMVNENIIRCLAIGAPDPEIKLALLSEIAQEHGVEWDSHRAHQEMVAGRMQNDMPDPRLQDSAGSISRGYGNYGGGSFPGPPSNFGGGGGDGGGGGNYGAPVAPPAPIFAPPPDAMSPPAIAPSPQSKFKTMLKKVPTLGRASSPSQSNENIVLSPSTEPEWRDAFSAASAAREYSQKAQNAADAAQRYASPTASSDLGEARPPAVVPAVGPPNGAPNTARPDYPDIDVEGPHRPTTNFMPMTGNLPPLSGQKAPPADDVIELPMPGQLPPGQFRQRSDEEIQRAYDAAPGPPAKSKPADPPSAPPAPGSRDISPGHGGDATKAEGAPAGGEDGKIDEDLAARFEALKRG